MGGHILEDAALALKEKHGLRYFVETGTWKGTTTLWAAQHFEKVWTIEADKGYYERAIGCLSGVGNIIMVLGDSSSQLAQILRGIDEPALLWLDAHWCRASEHERHAGYTQCPLLAELLAVKLRGIKHIVMIDDARLFLNPPPPPCDPVSWPNLDEVTGALPNYQFRIERDIIMAEPI